MFWAGNKLIENSLEGNADCSVLLEIFCDVILNKQPVFS